MLKIIWDKEIFARKIRSGEEKHILDFWMPVQIIVDGTDLTGLEENPKGEISQIFDAFVNLYYIFKLIDPGTFGNTNFNFESNVENEVSGGGFTWRMFPDIPGDLIRIKYHHFMLKPGEFRIINTSLREFAQGLLISTKEVLDDILAIDHGYQTEDEYIILVQNMNVIHQWYRNRYGSDAF